VAFNVGCRNTPEAIDALSKRFEPLGFEMLISPYKTPCTAVIARNRKFIEALEKPVGM